VVKEGGQSSLFDIQKDDTDDKKQEGGGEKKIITIKN